MRPGQAFAVVWIGWLVSWMLAAAWARRTASRPPRGSQTAYMLVQTVGFLMVYASLVRGWDARAALWRLGAAGQWALVAATASGVALSWWARIYLGAQWSGTVTGKEGHRLVDTGPYRFVRHPIYTGLLLAAYATVAAFARPLAFAGAGLITLALWLKARLEERFLSDLLGAQAYGDYRRRVPMLVPFTPP
jgi:protein-S-isoprenylcysteine O-methyltransferase Ste14